MNKGLPLAHKIAYSFSRHGFRGSSHIWKFARTFSIEKNGEIVFLPNGFPLIVDRTDWIARSIYEGTYERPLINFLSKISVVDSFVDVGANIGVTLWNGMQKSAPSSSYLAIEPSEQCQRGLELTTQNIDKPGRILKVALGQESSQRLMYGLNNPVQSGGASFVAIDGLNGEKEIIQVRTLDELINEGEVPKPIFLLKIDTEGYEEKVLAGSKDLILRFEVRVFILEVSPSFASTDWVRKLYNEISSGYTFFRLIEDGLIRRKTKIIQLGIEEAVSILDQWNLLVVRNDFLEEEIEITRMVKIS
jgi:FkbM family methyltransferase